MSDFSLIDMKRAYIAGIIDGEGTISIYKDKPQGNELNPAYSLRLQVINTNKDVVDFLQTTWSGRLYAFQRKPPNKQLYIWRLYGEKAIEAIVKVKPYIIVKRKQVDIAISFWENREPWAEGRTVSKHILDIREQYFIQMKEANKKGDNTDVEIVE